MYNTVKYKIIGITLLLMTVSALTWALQYRYFNAGNNNAKSMVDSAAKGFKYDKRLLTRFEEVSKKYDSLAKNNYTLAGVINMVNKADTTEKISNAGFLVCKAGNEFYYKLGETETINANGLYLFVDNAARKIILSEQLAVNYEQPGIKSFTSLGDNLKSEEYNMVSNVKGSEKTISLINEHHISCKQYAMSFDTTNMQLKRLYVRLTNFQDPLNKNKEKVLDVKIAEYDGKHDLNKYLTKNDVVKKENGEWKTVNRFADYQLIMK